MGNAEVASSSKQMSGPPLPTLRPGAGGVIDQFPTTGSLAATRGLPSTIVRTCAITLSATMEWPSAVGCMAPLNSAA